MKRLLILSTMLSTLAFSNVNANTDLVDNILNPATPYEAHVTYTDGTTSDSTYIGIKEGLAILTDKHGDNPFIVPAQNIQNLTATNDDDPVGPAATLIDLATPTEAKHVILIYTGSVDPVDTYYQGTSNGILVFADEYGQNSFIVQKDNLVKIEFKN